MRATEKWAVERGTCAAPHWDMRAFLLDQVAPTEFFQTPKIEQYSEASESFYSRLNDIADRRGGEMERGGRDFDMGR